MKPAPEVLSQPVQDALTIIKKSWVSLALHERECIKFWCGLHWPTELVLAEFWRLRNLAQIATEARDQEFPLQSRHVDLALGLFAEQVPVAGIVAALKSAGA